MNLQNGYKVIYEKAADGKRTFYASKTGVFADAEKILEAVIGEYKLVYEKNGKLYGSASGIPSDSDYYFVDADKVFKATETDETETPADNVTGGNSTSGGDKVDTESGEVNGPTYDLPTFEEEDEE